MFFKDNYRTNKDEVIRDNETWQSLVAYLIMSIDREASGEAVKGMDELVINEGKRFLDSIDSEEDRYELIAEEIDRINRIIEKGKLSGWSCESLFYYVKMVILDEDYSGNKRRLLRHITRKMELEKTVLPTLEDAVKSLDEISRKCAEIQDSTMPYKEAVSALAELETRKKSIFNELNELGINMEEETDDCDYISPIEFTMNEYKNLNQYSSIQDVLDAYEKHGITISYSDAVERYYYSKNEPVPEELRKKKSEEVIDTIGDYIVEGIMKVGYFVSAPFEWLSGVR